MRGFTWKSSMAALLATAALFGSSAASSAFSERHGDAPFGASTMGRGIAGQHNHFATGTPASHPHHHGYEPYGASTLGRGIAGYHSRH